MWVCCAGEAGADRGANELAVDGSGDGDWGAIEAIEDWNPARRQM